MIVSVEIETPANTTQALPLKTLVTAMNGLIYRMSLYFPLGSNGLLYSRMLIDNVQRYPTNRGSWFRGENVYIQFDDLYRFDEASQQLEFQTANLDTIYAHTCLWYIGIAVDSEMIAYYLQSTQMQNLTDALTALTVQMQTKTTKGVADIAKTLKTGKK